MGGNRNVHIVRPKDTLIELEARKRKGLTLSASAMRNTGLYDRAVRDFGSWTRALQKAGIEPLTRVRQRRPKPEKKRTLVPLTKRLLASNLSNNELSRRTGLDRKTIRTHRANMNGGRLSGRGALLEQLASVMRRSGKKKIETALFSLDPRAGNIVLRRSLADPPEPLSKVAKDLGLSVNRVGLIERKALADLLDRIR